MSERTRLTADDDGGRPADHLVFSQGTVHRRTGGQPLSPSAVQSDMAAFRTLKHKRKTNIATNKERSEKNEKTKFF